MSITELPGYEKALAMGYELRSYGGNEQSAQYFKGDLCLDIHYDPYKKEAMIATLSAMVGLFTISSGSFSFPHPLFVRWEGELHLMHKAALRAMQE